MRIHQHSVFLKNLVSDAAAGRLAPAAFQRPYVWQRADVLALCESILRGYPTGSFLTWTPNGKANLSKVGRPRLGPIQLQQGKEPSSLLLDGQNRLASMAWLLRDADLPLPEDLTDHERQVWVSDETLMVDLLTQQISYVKPADAEQGMKLPLRALVDSMYANPLVRKLWNTAWVPLGEDTITVGLKWFDRAQAAFSDARTVVTDMENATIEEARDAFMHICKVGVPMTETEFNQSIAWAQPN